MEASGRPRVAGPQDLKGRLWAIGLLGVLILLVVGFGLGNITFFTGTNTSIVLQQASITAVLATGMTFVIMTGGIDLSMGATLAAAATIALVVSFLPYFGMLGLVAGLAAGLLSGCVNGWFIAVLRLPPVLVTVATFAAVRALAHVLGGDRPISNPRLPFAFIGNGAIFGVPLLVIVALGVALVAWFTLRRTALGARIRVVGGAVDGAKLNDAERLRAVMVVYAGSGLLAGLGGVMSVSRLFAANTLQPGQSYMLDAVAAVILGGTRFTGGIGSISGTVVGALIIAVLTDGLVVSGVTDLWQVIVKGLIIIGALALDTYRTERPARA